MASSDQEQEIGRKELKFTRDFGVLQHALDPSHLTDAVPPHLIRYFNNLQELSKALTELMNAALLTQNVDRILILLDYQGRLQMLRQEVSASVGQEIHLKQLEMPSSLLAPSHLPPAASSLSSPPSPEQPSEENVVSGADDLLDAELLLRDIYPASPRDRLCLLHGPTKSHTTEQCKDLGQATQAREALLPSHHIAPGSPRAQQLRAHQPWSSSYLTPRDALVPELSPPRRPHRRISAIRRVGKAAAIALSSPIWLPFAIIAGGMGWNPPHQDSPDHDGAAPIEATDQER